MTSTIAGRDAVPTRLHSTRNRGRVLWSLGGVLLIAGCALGFGILAQQLADREPVVVVSRPVARGHVLARDDLAVAQVAADAGVPLVSAARSADLVGRVALTSLPAGALVHPTLLGPGTLAFDDGVRMLGLELEPGGYPTSMLAAGDTVTLIDTAGTGTVLADDAVVSDAVPAVEGATSLLVSVLIDAADAPAAAAAAGQDRVRLLLHGAAR